MEVISLITLLVLVVVVGMFAFSIALMALNALIRFLPAVLGVVFAVLLLGSGSDNAAVVVAIAGFVALAWWKEFAERFVILRDLDPFSEDGSSSWTVGKRKHYDTQGNVNGYSDRDD